MLTVSETARYVAFSVVPESVESAVKEPFFFQRVQRAPRSNAFVKVPAARTVFLELGPLVHARFHATNQACNCTLYICCALQHPVPDSTLERGSFVPLELGTKELRLQAPVHLG